jgi:hypothetical protein
VGRPGEQRAGPGHALPSVPNSIGDSSARSERATNAARGAHHDSSRGITLLPPPLLAAYPSAQVLRVQGISVQSRTPTTIKPSHSENS